MRFSTNHPPTTGQAFYKHNLILSSQQSLWDGDYLSCCTDEEREVPASPQEHKVAGKGEFFPWVHSLLRGPPSPYPRSCCRGGGHLLGDEGFLEGFKHRRGCPCLEQVVRCSHFRGGRPGDLTLYARMCFPQTLLPSELGLEGRSPDFLLHWVLSRK